MALFPQKFEVIQHFLFEHPLSNKQTLPLAVSKMRSVNLKQSASQRNKGQLRKPLIKVKKLVQNLLKSQSTLKAILKEILLFE